MLRSDMRNFMKQNNCERAVLVWCASTEAYNPIKEVHQSLKAFEAGLVNNDPNISPSQVYTYAAIKERIPYVNGSPNISVEIPALQELAHEFPVSIAGSDFKTGQTLMKTIIAPGLKNRLLGVEGWFSTNILGNRDGQVLMIPNHFDQKKYQKEVFWKISSPKKNIQICIQICIIKLELSIILLGGDNKEGWDNIDIVGWLGEKMQIKIDFLCKDSILAAPIVLDLALFY